MNLNSMINSEGSVPKIFISSIFIIIISNLENKNIFFSNLKNIKYIYFQLRKYKNILKKKKQNVFFLVSKSVNKS